MELRIPLVLNFTNTFQTIFNFESIRTHLLKFDNDIRKRNWKREKIAENALQTSKYAHINNMENSIKKKF